MFDEYPDVLTADALRVGYNALYRLLSSGKLKHIKMVGCGGFQRNPLRNTYWTAQKCIDK